MLYAIALVASVLSLSLWFYGRSRPSVSLVFRNLFFASLGLYVLGLITVGGNWEAKWATLIRDLGWLALVPVLLSMLASRKQLFFALLGLSALTTGWMAGTTDFVANSAEPAENEWELLLELAEGEEVDAVADVITQYGLTLEPAFRMEYQERTQLDDFYAVEIPERNEPLLEEIVLALQADAEVDWVEENEIVEVAPIESRRLPPVNRRFGIDDPLLENQWAYAALEIDLYFDLLRSTDRKPVRAARVFILDTGVDGTHPDLKANYRSLRSKYDSDQRKHGTHCAGIAGAVSNNGEGVASLSLDRSSVEITSVKVLGDYGVGSQRTIINGMLEAADSGADIISMSLGGRSTSKSQRAYAQAVEYANRAGTLVIAAAGNDGGSADRIAPANVPGVITVAALDTLLNRANFSNSVEGLQRGIAAPGVGIYSTLPGQQYGPLSGTSMATPLVAGLAGVLRSYVPELTTDELYAVLYDSGEETSAGATTSRLIRPAAALSLLFERYPR